MKKTLLANADAKLDLAFEKINSANSTELNKIVAIVEQYGRKSQKLHGSPITNLKQTKKVRAVAS